MLTETCSVLLITLPTIFYETGYFRGSSENKDHMFYSNVSQTVTVIFSGITSSFQGTIFQLKPVICVHTCISNCLRKVCTHYRCDLYLCSSTPWILLPLRPCMYRKMLQIELNRMSSFEKPSFRLYKKIVRFPVFNVCTFKRTEIKDSHLYWRIRRKCHILQVRTYQREVKNVVKKEGYRHSRIRSNCRTSVCKLCMKVKVMTVRVRKISLDW
jgi:hypothetical protein